MNLTRCSQGHFYDTDAQGSCPHCAGGSSAVQASGLTMPLTIGDSNQELTVRGDNILNDGPTAPLNATLQDAVKNATLKSISQGISDDDSKTVSFYHSTIGSEPVVGWLVCISGAHYGEDFKLKSGRNFIGRAPGMDVVISKDTTVSREKHAVVVYEPRNHIFLVQPGDSKELFYLNDNVVLQAQEIKINDILMVGETELMFFPCCSKEFNWELYKNKTETFDK